MRGETERPGTCGSAERLCTPELCGFAQTRGLRKPIVAHHCTPLSRVSASVAWATCDFCPWPPDRPHFRNTRHHPQQPPGLPHCPRRPSLSKKPSTKGRTGAGVRLRFILWILSCLAARGGRTGTYTRTRTSMMHERRDRATWHLRERGEVVHTRTVWVCANPGFAQTYCCTPLHAIISCLRKRSLGDVRLLPVASGPTDRTFGT